jgi:hypothetical protein
MTSNEKKALVSYFDDQLMTMCRQMSMHLDPQQTGDLYHLAYDLVHDLEHTLECSVELTHAERLSVFKNKR